MKLCELFELYISDDKLLKYLLSGSQIRSTDKSKLFLWLGFTTESYLLLKHELLTIATLNEVDAIKENEYGIIYIINGKVQTPSGRSILLQTVWHVLDESKIARFVTAYPKKN